MHLLCADADPASTGLQDTCSVHHGGAPVQLGRAIAYEFALESPGALG